MRIICKKSNLVKGVSIVSKAVPSKTTMPILECILIDATTDVIKLTANDMELGIETTIDGIIDSRGIIALNAKIFSEIVRKLPDNDVVIETESDNQAIISAAMLGEKQNKRHIISTAFEHHAVLYTCEALEKEGYRVTYLNVDKEGRVDLEQLKAELSEDTALVSVMAANNEIGTIQPIKEIGRIAKEHNILFHTDAVQAFGQIPINVDECNIDMLSSSGHKLNGPKGIGFLYIRKGVKIRSFVHGGAQERKRRAGTENVPGIVGFGKAVELAVASMDDRIRKETELRDYAIARIEKEIPYCRLNGHRTDRLPNNANFSFQFVEGESLLIKLDMKGICASSGSACTSGSLDPSHVLLAIGLPHEIAHGSLRLTLNEEIENEDIDYVVDNLKEIVAHLREMSPLYEDFIKKQK